MSEKEPIKLGTDRWWEIVSWMFSLNKIPVETLAWLMTFLEKFKP